MTAPADLIFLPWVRRGGSTALQQADTSTAAQPGMASATVTLEVNSVQTLSMDVALMGPGHVTAISSAQVIRTDPTPGSVSFEPNFCPLIEFDEPSLPWLFTPARAGAESRLRPWLCLAIVRKQNGMSLGPPDRGSVPVLRIGAPALPSAELPDPADSWAWAHAQLTAESGSSTGALTDLLAGAPERSLSRLLSGRVLRPDTQYLACVVPTFELGRKAGLGLDVIAADEAKLDPAWHPSDPAVELPVYYHWEFTTGPGGDFQSLALLLRARPLPAGVGQRPIDISHSGVDVAVPDGTQLSLGGALRPVQTGSTAWPDETVHSRFRTELARLLNLSTADDPILTPPRYGDVVGGVDPARTDRWYEQLNLEPPTRVAAQFGTRVVQEQQEALVSSAWEQAADLRTVNQTLRHAQLGALVAVSLHTRHVRTMTPDVGLQVLAPAQSRLTRTAAALVPGTGLVALLADAHLSAAAFGAPLRRIARTQGALNRRLERVAPTPGAQRTTSILRALQPTMVIARRLPSSSGPATLERVTATLSPPRDDITWAEANAAAVKSAPRRPTFHILPPVGPAPAHALLRRVGEGNGPPDPPTDPPVDPPDPPPHHPPPIKVDSADAAAFRVAAQAHLARFNPLPPMIFVPPPHVAAIGDVFTAALAVAEPGQHYAVAVTAIVDFKGVIRPAEQALDPVALTPTFPQPMALSLADLGQELLLPGLDGVPPNTIVPLETNTPFVEAFLVGLNTELGRELLWREFPVPAGTTFFDRFWDGVQGAPPDITPIATWGDRALGAPSTGGTDERFVMLIRSDLLRRYPHAVIYATQAASGGQPAKESFPIFSGALLPDVRFFGFDIPADEFSQWSIVIQEQPSAPRFGVEVGVVETSSHLPVTGDPHSARVADRLRQTPVRIAIPSSVLLAEV